MAGSVDVKAIVVGGGVSPGLELLDWLDPEGSSLLVAADGGADSLRALHKKPQRLIGDFDSITPETLAWCQSLEGCRVQYIPRQSDTDIEKCLDVLMQEGVREISLCGVFGDRLDHSLSNLAIVLRWSQRMRITVYAGQSVLEVMHADCTFLATIGAVISIYAFNPEVRISTQGLKFPLHDEPLMFGVRESTSNAASADRVHINVGGGPALLVRDLDEVRLYGFVLEQA